MHAKFMAAFFVAMVLVVSAYGASQIVNLEGRMAADVDHTARLEQLKAELEHHMFAARIEQARIARRIDEQSRAIGYLVYVAEKMADQAAGFRPASREEMQELQTQPASLSE